MATTLPPTEEPVPPRMKCRFCPRRRVPGRKACPVCLEAGRQKYWARKAAGICGKCGLRPARPGRTCCVECTAQVAATQAKRYDKRKADGLCTYCGRGPPAPHRLICSECYFQDRRQEARKKRRGSLEHVEELSRV